jgi:hypothetical protein
MPTRQKKQATLDPEEVARTAQPSDPTRCGGYVLTDEGWVLAAEDEA